MGIVTDIDFTPKTVQLTYPSLEVDNLNDLTPLVVGLLQPGSIPVVGVYQGKKKVMARVSPSAYNVDKILRTHDGVYVCESETDKHLIRSVKDWLEVLLRI